MAWRIDEFVVKGEIDNRVRGHVRGRIWFAGREEPVELRLRGNCWRDLAGRRLMFTNPEPKAGLEESFAQRQDGVTGDVTASRKVKVPEIPMDQIGEYYAAKKPWPWHWGNSLYMEWFGARNGRVVIETAAFELTVAGEAAWEMTAEEETAQREENGRALLEFMKRFGGPGSDAAVDDETELGESGEGDDAEAGSENDGDEEWRGIAPQTEAEAEAMQARSDLLADRVEARMRREGEGADYERILEEEIERMRRERGEPEPTEEQLERNAAWIEEMNRAADEALANRDDEAWERAEHKHPLAERAFELTVGLHRECEEAGWAPKSATPEHPAAELVGAVGAAGAKLAGALNGEDWPPEIEFCAGVIVRLKRARGYFDDALAAAECCREQGIVIARRLDEIGKALREMAAETDALIEELRGRLERGMD